VADRATLSGVARWMESTAAAGGLPVETRISGILDVFGGFVKSCPSGVMNAAIAAELGRQTLSIALKTQVVLFCAYRAPSRRVCTTKYIFNGW